MFTTADAKVADVLVQRLPSNGNDYARPNIFTDDYLRAALQQLDEQEQYLINRELSEIFLCQTFYSIYV